MSRPRKPIHLHAVEGTFRPDRHADWAVPQHKPVKEIKPPRHLSKPAKKAFKQLVEQLGAEQMNVIIEQDALAIEMLAQAYADFWEVTKLLETQGRFTTRLNKFGDEIITANPLIRDQKSAHDRVRELLIQMGLTPAARTKVKVVDNAKAADPYDSKKVKAF